MRTVLLAAVTLVLLTAVVLVVALSRIDVESLAPLLSEEIRRQTDIDLHAQQVDFHPMRGIVFSGVEAESEAEAGSLSASIDRVTLAYRLLPLLRGKVSIDEIVLERPVIELVSKSAKDPGSRRADPRAGRSAARRPQEETKPADVVAATAARDGHLQLAVERLRIEQGRFSARAVDSRNADLRIENLGVDLRNLQLAADSVSNIELAKGRGTFAGGGIVYGDFVARQASGKAELAGGVARITQLQVRTANAQLEIVEARVRLDLDPFRYELEATGRLDLNAALRASEGGNFGPVSVELKARGRGPELDRMRGDGSLILTAGSIPGFPTMQQIEGLLGRQLLTGRAYTTTTIAYRLADSELLIVPFELMGEGGSVGGAGSVGLNGDLDLDLFVRLPRERLEAGVLQAADLEALSDEGGRVRLPFRLSGSLEDPKISVELEALRELLGSDGAGWVERALEEAAERARDWLEGQVSGEDGEP